MTSHWIFLLLMMRVDEIDGLVRVQIPRILRMLNRSKLSFSIPVAGFLTSRDLLFKKDSSLTANP